VKIWANDCYVVNARLGLGVEVTAGVINGNRKMISARFISLRLCRWSAPTTIKIWAWRFVRFEGMEWDGV
jgi:hypothetical protein